MFLKGYRSECDIRGHIFEGTRIWKEMESYIYIYIQSYSSVLDGGWASSFNRGLLDTIWKGDHQTTIPDNFGFPHDHMVRRLSTIDQKVGRRLPPDNRDSRLPSNYIWSAQDGQQKINNRQKDQQKMNTGPYGHQKITYKTSDQTVFSDEYRVNAPLVFGQVTEKYKQLSKWLSFK